MIIMFLACYHLIYGTVELSEIHIVLKFKLERIEYILIDYKLFHQIFDCSIARKQNKVVHWFVKPKPLVVISF